MKVKAEPKASGIPAATRKQAPAAPTTAPPYPYSLRDVPVHPPDRPAPLPHHARIQAAFGRHDLSGVRSTISPAPAALGARAYAQGDEIAFQREPDVRLAAHEAAHIIQQRGGTATEARTADNERHADQVADTVARGQSAEPLLDRAVAPGASPTVAVQLDRDDDDGSDAALIAVLERTVGANDTKAQRARVRDLTALLIALPGGKALAIAQRLTAPHRADKLARLFHYKLSSRTRERLLLAVQARWAMQFGTFLFSSQPTAAPAKTTAKTDEPAPEPTRAEPDPDWRELARIGENQLETSKLTTGGTPSLTDIATLLNRLQRDDLKGDDQLRTAAHLDKRVFEIGGTDIAWLRFAIAVRLETFVQLYENLTYLPDQVTRSVIEARAFLDAHSAEYVGHATHETARAMGGVLQTVAYANEPVMTINDEPAVRRWEVTPERIQKIKRDAAIQILITPALIAAEIGDRLKFFVGYPIGVLSGAKQAVEDLVEAGLANIKEALTLMWSVFTGEFIKKLVELGEKIYDLISKLPDLASTLGKWFAAEWRKAGYYGKGKLVGKIVGYIAMTIVIGILTEGGSLEASGSELQQTALRFLKIADKAANPFTYVKPVAKVAAKIPGVARTVETVSQVTSRVTTPVRELAAKGPQLVKRLIKRGGKTAEEVGEEAEGAAPRAEAALQGAKTAEHEMPTMAEIEAAAPVAAAKKPSIAREPHDLTPVIVDGELWLRLCSKKCGPLLEKLRETDNALAKAGATKEVRRKVRDLIERTDTLQREWDLIDPTAAEKRLEALSNELEALGTSNPTIGKAIADGDAALIEREKFAAARARAKRGPEQAPTFEGGQTVRGFEGMGELMERGGNLKKLAAKHGYADAVIGVRGSAVTNVSSKGGAFRWDLPDLSDVDFFVSGPSLDAKIADIERGTGALVVDGRIKTADLPRLDLELAKDLNEFAKATRKQIGRSGDATVLTTGLVDSLDPSEWVKLR